MLADQSFVVPPLPTIVFNRGASQQLSNQIQALGKSAALIVTCLLYTSDAADE